MKRKGEEHSTANEVIKRKIFTQAMKKYGKHTKQASKQLPFFILFIVMSINSLRFRCLLFIMKLFAQRTMSSSSERTITRKGMDGKE